MHKPRIDILMDNTSKTNPKIGVPRSINIDYKNTPYDALEDKNILQSFFYTRPEDAMNEIYLRRKESDFKVSNLYPNVIDIESKYSNKVIGLVHRDITPNLEIARMIDTCDFMGICPVLLNYENDLFSCLSRSKYLLGKMAFFSGYGKSGGMKVEFKKVIDFDGAEGKKLNEIKTVFGDDLMTFHKKIFNERYHFLERSEYDITLLSNSILASEIYKFLFFLSIINGVFLEHFLFSGLEKKFVDEIVFPAFRFVWESTGYKPLVVPFEPTDNDDADFWHYYYFNIKDIIENKYNVTL